MFSVPLKVTHVFHCFQWINFFFVVGFNCHGQISRISSLLQIQLNSRCLSEVFDVMGDGSEHVAECESRCRVHSVEHSVEQWVYRSILALRIRLKIQSHMPNCTIL
jgi:hypothetical protein